MIVCSPRTDAVESVGRKDAAVSEQKQSKRNSIVVALSGLGWPLLLGLAAATAFYVLVFRGPLGLPLLQRYFGAHPVSYAATAMFFVGLASLLLKSIDVVRQSVTLGAHSLHTDGGEASGGAGSRVVATGRCGELLEKLENAGARRSYLGNRLCNVLQYVDRNGGGGGLSDELKHLADGDTARQHESYSLVRIIIWATPMLGFLGTVIGITQALGDLDPQLLATDAQVAMERLLSGLYVAFDTTALSLSLSIVLMFVQFLVERVETQLLAAVDDRVEAEAVGCFEEVGGVADPYVSSVQRMSGNVLAATEQLVTQQVEIWQTTIDAAHQQWAHLVEDASGSVRTELVVAMREALGEHVRDFAAAQREAEQQRVDHLAQWRELILQNAQLLEMQQNELAQQGHTVRQLVEATGELAEAERSLHERLVQVPPPPAPGLSSEQVERLEETLRQLNATMQQLAAQRVDERLVPIRRSTPGRVA